jgi:heme exporter protein A
MRGVFAPCKPILNEPLLMVRDLSCSAGRRMLFENLDIALGAGECIEIWGANGSGKTTLLRCIAGLLKEESGSVAIGDQSQPLYLGHKLGLNPVLSPLENMHWYLALEGQKLTNVECVGALHAVGLNGSHHKPCQALSLGQQRRAALARLVVSRSSLWLLDEPLSALDEPGQELVRSLVLEKCSSGGAVLCATHQSLGLPNVRLLEVGV